MQELEAAKERNDLDVNDLREMSLTELRQVGTDLELDTRTEERKEDLVDKILLFVAPEVAGSGPTVVTSLAEPVPVTRLTGRAAGEDVLLTAYVHEP